VGRSGCGGRPPPGYSLTESLQACPESFVASLHPPPTVGTVSNLAWQESLEHMDLIAVALIAGLAVVGLAWIAFADRI
jgi:hypothetical protein